jgi:Mor family transcriptional regulator
MRYIRADEILPPELLEAVQKYIDGQLIYIPSKEKQEWGSVTASRKYYCERNREIFLEWKAGASTEELSLRFSLSEKSVQRILRQQKAEEVGEYDGQ